MHTHTNGNSNRIYNDSESDDKNDVGKSPTSFNNDEEQSPTSFNNERQSSNPFNDEEQSSSNDEFFPSGLGLDDYDEDAPRREVPDLKNSYYYKNNKFFQSTLWIVSEGIHEGKLMFFNSLFSTTSISRNYKSKYEDVYKFCAQIAAEIGISNQELFENCF